MIAALFAAFCTHAQNDKSPQNAAQGVTSNGNTVTRYTASKPYSFEKKVNGVMVQYYTQEQFARLPENRKAYYSQHSEQFKIIPTKK